MEIDMKVKPLSLACLLAFSSFSYSGQVTTPAATSHQDKNMEWFTSNADSYLLMSLGLIGLGIARKKQR
jgi:hypothetical protein